MCRISSSVGVLYILLKLVICDTFLALTRLPLTVRLADHHITDFQRVLEESKSRVGDWGVFVQGFDTNGVQRQSANINGEGYDFTTGLTFRLYLSGQNRRYRSVSQVKDHLYES